MQPRGVMGTLLLRFAGPMQSWGIDSNYGVRQTERQPSKSGIVGLLAAAQGRLRGESVEDLSALRMGVRVDQEGTLQSDFQMVRGIKDSYVTRRYYLSDAVFVVGIESDNEEMLRNIANAVQHPKFPLYLGRRAYVPAGPIVLGVRHGQLENVFRSEPWTAADWYKCKFGNKGLRVRIEGNGNMSVLRKELLFNDKFRRYGYVSIEETMMEFNTDHDPMKTVDQLTTVNNIGH